MAAFFSIKTGGSTYYGLTQVPLEGVLIEANKDTRRIYNIKFRQIGRTTRQYGQSFSLKLLVHRTGLISLKLHHWLYLYQIMRRLIGLSRCTGHILDQLFK